MANNVTGNYDVVVQVSLPAINRFLAVMHEAERFLHSLSGYINDAPPPPSLHLPPIVLTGVADLFGKAVADQRRIPRQSFSGTVATNDVLSALRPPIVNPGGGLLAPPRVIPSNLSGNVQLQIFPPTVDVPDASGTKLSATMNAMVRYFPDPKTAPIAEFLRGNLQIVAPINQISTQVGNVIEFDFKADQVAVSFTPTFTSSTLSASDKAAISLAIHNALRTSFQPSSATLPGGVSALQFKTLLSGGQKAGALLLNLTNHSSDPHSVQQIALHPGDDFAFAINPEYISSLLNSSISQLTDFPAIPVSLWPFSATYTISLTSPPPALEFQNGAIQLVINAHAHSSGSIFPSFNFKTVVSFGLNLVPIDAQGRLGAAELKLSGVDFDFTDSGVGGDIKDVILGAFKGTIKGNIANSVSNILASTDPNSIQTTVRNQTNIDTQIGNLVNSLLKDPTTGDEPDASLRLVFSYTAVDIQSAGVILRGLETVHAWADPYVEFDQVSSPPKPSGPLGGVGGGVGQPSGPDYTALNTWIPGGTVTQYEWSVSYNNQLYPFGVDPNKFVLLHSGPVLEADNVSVSNGGSLPPYTPLCLTVRGTRPSSSGAGPAVAVSASVCGVHHLPLPGIVGEVGNLPTLALVRRGPSGHIVVTGHAAPQAAQRSAPNLLVHFADAKSAAELKALPQALKHSKRPDATAAVMAIVPVGHLETLHFTPEIVYAENDAAWERAFGLGKAARPLTVIIDPTGKVVWRHEGAIDQHALAAALTKTLVPTFAGAAKLLRLNATLGQPAPDFLFEYTPGHAMPLKKLKGRRVALVFWRSGSAPSMQAITAAEHAKNGAQPPLVLAINDGEAADHAHRALAQAKTNAIPVADPGRLIAAAYGVTAWPTIISIDASGTISGIQIGNAAAAPEHASVQATQG